MPLQLAYQTCRLREFKLNPVSSCQMLCLVFWDVMLCTLVQQYQCFREPCHIPQKHGYLFTRLYGIMSKHSVTLTLSALTAKKLTCTLLFAEWIFNFAHVTYILILRNSTYIWQTYRILLLLLEVSWCFH